MRNERSNLSREPDTTNSAATPMSVEILAWLAKDRPYPEWTTLQLREIRAPLLCDVASPQIVDVGLLHIPLTRSKPEAGYSSF